MLRILDETESYILTSQHEHVEVRNKKSGKIIHVGDHYGNPVGGLISRKEDWCISAGEGVVVSDFEETLWCAFRDTGLGSSWNKIPIKSRADNEWLESKCAGSACHIHAMKFDRGNSVRILLDPWAGYASVWLFDDTAKHLTKLQDGPNMAESPWQEDVDF